jgi:transposase
MGSMRSGLVSARTQLINTVRGWMRAQARRAPSGSAETFHKRVRLVSENKGWPIPTWVDQQLLAIEMLTGQIRASDKELTQLAEGDEECRRLMTMPGIGPLTAIQFKAALDEVGRFETAHRVASYIGLTPGERSSSERQHRTGITKAGSPRLRWLLSQAAWSAMFRAKEDPMVRWAREVQLRRGVHVAVIALARKMAGILYAMWRDRKDYDPARAATHREVTAA